MNTRGQIKKVITEKGDTVVEVKMKEDRVRVKEDCIRGDWEIGSTGTVLYPSKGGIYFYADTEYTDGSEIYRK